MVYILQVHFYCNSCTRCHQTFAELSFLAAWEFSINSSISIPAFWKTLSLIFAWKSTFLRCFPLPCHGKCFHCRFVKSTFFEPPEIPPHASRYISIYGILFQNWWVFVFFVVLSIHSFSLHNFKVNGNTPTDKFYSHIWRENIWTLS